MKQICGIAMVVACAPQGVPIEVQKSPMCAHADAIIGVIPLIANPRDFVGCQVGVHAIFRIEEGAYLFLTQEDAKRFNTVNAVALEMNPTADDATKTLLPDGTALSVPFGPADAFVEGTVNISKHGDISIGKITSLKMGPQLH